MEKRKLIALFWQVNPAMMIDIPSRLYDKCCFIEGSLTRLLHCSHQFFRAPHPCLNVKWPRRCCWITKGGFAHASVYKSKSEGRSVSLICWCCLLPSTHLYLPTYQENPSAAAGGDDAWPERCWELSQQQARGKTEMVIAPVRVGQHCHVLQPLTLLSRATAHPESADSKPHFPWETKKTKHSY